MTRDELKVRATELGLEFKSNTPTVDLQEMIEEVEIEAKAEQYDKPAPTTDSKSVTDKKTKANIIKEAYRLVRCIITPLDERMRELPSDTFAVGTPTTGFIKKVVRFNVETDEPLSILRVLNRKTTLLQVQSTDAKGKPVMIKKLMPAFNIRLLPKYTDKELEEKFGKKN